MKILILGHGRHGKDTAAEHLNKYFNVSFKSSSEFANEKVVFPVLAPVYGYKTAEQCFEDRAEHRDEWYTLIRHYNEDDRSRLCKQLMLESNMYVGMRCDEEYQASKHLFDLVIWVDASSRLDSDPTMKIQFDRDEMMLLNNNSTPSAFLTNILVKFQFLNFLRIAA